MALVTSRAVPRQAARNSGSPRNSTTLPLPWLSTAAHVVPLSSRSVLPGQVKPDSVRESPVNVTGFAPPLDGCQNVAPSMSTGRRSRS